MTYVSNDLKLNWSQSDIILQYVVCNVLQAILRLLYIVK